MSDSSWTSEDRDKLLDLFLAGRARDEIAKRVGRDPIAIKRVLKALAQNKGDAAFHYEPARRTSRKGADFTKNERKLIETLRKHSVASSDIAKLLRRNVSEIAAPSREVCDIKRHIPLVGIGVDLVLAHRFLYWCIGKPVISDDEYDLLKSEEREFGAYSDLLDQPASDKREDYPARIKALAYYLQFKYS